MAAKPTPPALPKWMKVDPDGIQPNDLGYANMDQYNSSWGMTPSSPLSGEDRGPDPYFNKSTRDLPIGDTGKWSQGGTIGLAPRVDPSKAALGDILNNPTSPTVMNPKGEMGYGADPTTADRWNRAAKGFVSGIDTGSTLGNIGVNVGTKMLGPAAQAGNRVGGAVQGYRSNDKVFKGSFQGAAPNTDKGGYGSDAPSASSSSLPSGGGGFYAPEGSGLNAPEATPSYPGTSGSTATTSMGGPDPGFAQNPISGRPPAEGTDYLPPQEAVSQALNDILSGGQNYQTDGAGGRRGVAGAGSGYEFSGFDFGQDPSNRDIGKSAKYAFSHLAGKAAQSGAPAPRTKAEAEAWFSQHIAPGMNELGFTVHKVVGDKAFISAPEHPEGAWVDFLIGADGNGPTPLAWQAELGPGMDTDPEAIFALQSALGGGDDSPSGMARGPSGVLDSGNGNLDSFADMLIKKLLAGEALEDTLGTSKKSRGISPESLAMVGF